MQCRPPVPFPLRGMCSLLPRRQQMDHAARDEQAGGEGFQSGSAGQERTSNSETQF